MMNYVLAPSILAAVSKFWVNEMKKTEDNGAEYIHFEVMVGMFVSKHFIRYAGYGIDS